MSDCLILLLPVLCDPADSAAQWWHWSGDGIVDSGSDERWRALVTPPTGRPGLPLIALAPVAAVRLSFAQPQGETVRQQAGVARAAALETSIAESATLHAVAAPVEGRLAVAVVANGAMIEWLDWLARQGAEPEAIVPAGLMLPAGEEWRALAIGSERMIGHGDLVLPDEPALREAFVKDGEVAPLSSETVMERLGWIAALRPLNLRSGRFARRRLLLLDWRRVRELAALVLLIPLIGLVMAMVMIVRLDRSSDRLEAETARLAEAALGTRVTAATAGAALDARISQVPGASGSPFAPLAAVYQQVQQVPGATASSVSWRPDGTLSVGLAATRAEDLNRILHALQRAGYRVTATSRIGATGQALADVTVRSRA